MKKKQLWSEVLWWIYLYLWGVFEGWNNNIYGVVIGLVGIIIGVIIALIIYKLEDK